MDYLEKKSQQTAHEIARLHNIDFFTAYQMTSRLYSEARRAILNYVESNPEKWEALPPNEKATVCAQVIQGLLDKKKLIGFLAGEKTSIM